MLSPEGREADAGEVALEEQVAAGRGVEQAGVRDGARTGGGAGRDDLIRVVGGRRRLLGAGAGGVVGARGGASTSFSVNRVVSVRAVVPAPVPQPTFSGSVPAPLIRLVTMSRPPSTTNVAMVTAP
jgi:hypothetical protein